MSKVPIAISVLALLWAGGSQATAAQVVYTFESPDTGTTVTDVALDDGAQNPTLNVSAVVDATGGAFGSQSLDLPHRVFVVDHWATTVLGVGLFGERKGILVVHR